MTTSPTHVVTLYCARTRAVHVYQPFSLAYAEAVLRAYREHGWTGDIEERS